MSDKNDWFVAAGTCNELVEIARSVPFENRTFTPNEIIEQQQRISELKAQLSEAKAQIDWFANELSSLDPNITPEMIKMYATAKAQESE